MEIDRLKQAFEERTRVLQDAIEQRERELAVLAHVASRVHGADTVQAILDIAIEEILGRLELTTAWIFTGDDREKRLTLSASRGVNPAYLEEVQRDGLGECLCPEVFWSGHVMQARNTTQCPRMPDIVEGLHAPVAHACIPLKFEGTTKGLLNVAARPGQQFSRDELRFLETLGHQIGLAVERARHREAERMRHQEARALAEINKAIGGSLDASVVLKAVGDTARAVLGAERALIFLGSDPRALTVAHVSGTAHPELKMSQRLDLVAAGSRLQVRALEEGCAFSVDDWSHDPRVNQSLADKWEAHSGVVAPLLAGERRLGLLLLTKADPHHWSEQQLELAEALAAQAAVALENARLYQDAREALRELKAAQERLIRNEKMVVLGTFASGLAHEVRNPLNSIALQLSILERRASRLEAGMTAEIGELTAIIREEIKRLDTLVNDFLLFSRADRVQHHPADLDQLIDEVMRLLRPEARSAGVTLRRERAGEPLTQFAMDAEKIKQVVINLVRNAIEALVDGGTVVVESGLSDGQARLAVRDDGPGLPQGLDVFQLFVTTKPGGTGLGLAIVQQIILQHGGDIRVESEPGQGASFVIHLPVTPVARARRRGQS